VSRLASRAGLAGDSDVDALVAACEQRNWPTERRACVADARNAAEIDACLPSSKDVRVPPPDPPEPSPENKQLVAKASDPVRALLFFRPDDPVGAQVEHYLRALGKLVIERHDRLMEPQVARNYHATADGQLVFVRGDRSERLEIGTSLERASPSSGNLRDLDLRVAYVLQRLLRDTGTVYLVAGHGEISYPAPIPLGPSSKVPARRVTVLATLVSTMGYRIASLRAADLAGDVPADASAVLLLAPTTELAAAEWDALARYLDRDGGLLVALDPTSSPSLGPLEAKLGVKFQPTHLCDDTNFLPQKQVAADHALVVTTAFADHAATATLSKHPKPLVLVDSGVLEPVTGAATNPAFIVRSMSSAFVDLNGNHVLDPPKEHRASWNVAAAVTLPKGRALVLADVELVADVVVTGGGPMSAKMQMLGDVLVTDALTWLAGDHAFVPTPVRSPAIHESPERIAAKLERAERDLEHALAAAIAIDPIDRRDAARRVPRLQTERDELRRKLTQPEATNQAPVR
jgi:hypothetical protein